MFTYELNVAMSKKTVPLDEVLINSIKEAIDIANSSFSATRYVRTIEYIEQIDEFHIHLRMNSLNQINPSRSLSSLARALVQNECTKNSTLLEKYIYNGSVFITTLISCSEETKSHMSDVEMMQELTAMIFNQAVMNNRDKKLSRDFIEKIRTLVIDYVNQKTQ